MMSAPIRTGRKRPTRSPTRIRSLPSFADILHVERLGEILSQEVRRTALQRLAVLHQRSMVIVSSAPAKRSLGDL